MTRGELEQEVLESRYNYVWGLQAEDIAMSVYPDSEGIEDNEIFSESELTNTELNQRIYEEIKGSNFHIHEWSEQVSYNEFSDETHKLLKTLAVRYKG